MDDVPHLPAHESLRRMIGDAQDVEYKSYETLADAAHDDEAVAILEGDDGGQIYAVVPVGDIKCPVEALEHLLSDLDAIAWPGNDANSKRVYFEHQPVGNGIPGGMGGAASTGALWVHEDFLKIGLAADIEAVVSGELDRIRTSGRDSQLP